MPETTDGIEINARWADALLSAQILVAGAGLIGGIRLRAGTGPVRDCWLETVHALFNAGSGCGLPWIRVPASSAAGRLTGGIDIAATLAAGRPVHENGILARADGGFVILGMAERLSDTSAAIIGRALDDGVAVGSSGRIQPARFSLIALDESAGEEEDLPPALADRLTLDLQLDGLSIHEAVSDPDLVRRLAECLPSPGACAAAMKAVTVPDEVRGAAAAISLALPESSVRRALDLIRVARLLAVLGQVTQVSPEHLAVAARLCLGINLDPQSEQPQLPEVSESDDGEDRPPSPPEAPAGEEQPDTQVSHPDPSEEDMLVAAAQASRAVLAALDRPDRSMAAKLARTGKSGGIKTGSRRGRPAGIVSRPPYAEARPDVVSTLRAAIPWQRLRNPDFALRADGSVPPLRILPNDFRYIRFRHRTESTAIFAVDASGSTAMERLAEAKGAIELLLGDCYVRRDQVALISFRGSSAETLLEPTRSLVRAKRSLTGLPGGGPTPLAGAIRRSLEIAGMVQRRGQSPLIVYLTDGSGNIALDGKADRVRAGEDAQMLARQGAALGYRSILIDISRRPRESTRELARSMQAQYCPLPIVSASAVNAIVSAELSKGAGQ
ncbi:MAG: magnesium chelatase ATPase subunit D [Hoeflea sp.]|nr:magnesium chelatase ATPase subunit D [Hoeflea sp.]